MSICSCTAVLSEYCEGVCLHVCTGNTPQKNKELTFYVTCLKSVNCVV